MKRIALWAAAVAVAGCSPSIDQTAPKEHVIIEFNPAASPPAVPAPNDLAIDPTTGKVNAPIDPSSPKANQDFTRDYLNTLDGFPEGSVAEAIVGGFPGGPSDLDPATVTTSTVLVTDLTDLQTGGTGQVAGATPTYDPSTHALLVLPPNGAWTKGHDYEIVVLGGANGVKATDGSQVFGSNVFALARGTTSLVTCTDLTSSDCVSTTGLVSDNAQAVQLETLRRNYAPLFAGLEQQGINRNDVASLWTFKIHTEPEMTFDPVNSVIPFPSDLVVKPLADGGVQVNLPIPDGGILPDGGIDPTNLQAQLIVGLNTLNGFSTTAPIVTENSDTLPVLDDGELDPASINPLSLNLVPTAGASTMPDVKACVIPDMAGCVTSSAGALPDGGYALPDGGAVPQQLQLIPQVPLDENAQYGVFATTDLKAKGDKGHVVPTTAFALFKLADPLVDSSGKSQVVGVSDAQAAQIEPARSALKPFFDGLEAQGIPRSKVALAWVFNTQAEQSVLNAVHGFPAAAAIPFDPITLGDGSALLTCGGTCAYPTSNIAAAFVGTFADPVLLTGTGGTFNPAIFAGQAAPAIASVPFVLTLPKGTPPAGGWPVVIFGHGLGGHHLQAMAGADSWAQAGFAMIAIDEVWHGERSSCTGVYGFLFSSGLAPALPPGTPANVADGLACSSPAAVGGSMVCDEALPVGHCVDANPANQADCTYLSPTAGDATCQAAAGNVSGTQGVCLANNKCANGDFGRNADGSVQISGWNLFNLANLFATRDNFRQQVVDNAQEARVAAGGDATDLNFQLNVALGTAGSPIAYLDGTKINYVGQSLGGILGTLYSAAAPEVHNTVLDVPAGDLINVLLTTPSPQLSAIRNGFFATLASQGIPPGTPAFDDFLGIAKWIIDPADPINAGHSLWHGVAPSDRHAFIQFIENDQTLPNETTEELIAATVRQNMGEKTCSTGVPPLPSGQTPPCADVFEFTDAAFGAALPSDLGERHGFLLNGSSTSTPAGAATQFGQEQAAQYLATGTVKTTFP